MALIEHKSDFEPVLFSDKVKGALLLDIDTFMRK